MGMVRWTNYRSRSIRGPISAECGAIKIGFIEFFVGPGGPGFLNEFARSWLPPSSSGVWIGRKNPKSILKPILTTDNVLFKYLRLGSHNKRSLVCAGNRRTISGNILLPRPTPGTGFSSFAAHVDLSKWRAMLRCDQTRPPNWRDKHHLTGLMPFQLHGNCLINWDYTNRDMSHDQPRRRAAPFK